MNNLELEQDHLERIRVGEIANNGLESEFWKLIVKPIITSMLVGLKDATTIDVSSDKKAALEVKSRTIAASYLDKIEALINEFVMDGNSSKTMIEKANQKNELYKVND